ncbi:thiol reductant ABC exporter subunit CydC [Aeromicrobium sp. CF3.5]|uniref:thiol reductant ABC exporter subunit CydC n=1 Tax=Aeromicrobium sp. CF3.5 TaxID=3373078 RepID=UPI003EE54856
MRLGKRQGVGSRLGWGRALGVLSQLAGIGLLLVSSWLIVRAAEQPPVLYLMVAVVSVRFFGLARAALRYAERLLTHDAAFATLTDARVAVHGELDRVAPAGLGRRRRGDLVHRVVSDVDSVLDRMLRLRSPWITALGSAAVLVAVLAWLVPAAAAVVAAQTVVSMAAVRYGMAVHARRQVDAVHLRGEMSADVAEAVRAAPDLVMAGAAGPVLTAVRERTTVLGRAQQRGVGAAAAAGAAVTALTGVAMAACALLTADIAPVLVGVAVLAPLAMLEPLEALADAERLRPEIEAARRRLADLSSVPTPVADPVQSRAVPAAFDLVAEDLVVGWPDPVTGAHTEPISFELSAGGVMVVTGPSGSGKSTLGLTMARLLDPVDGVLRLGGIDVRDLRGNDVRSVVGVLAQDEIVFNTSIRENLLIAAPSASDVDLWRALAAAGIGRFVESLPRGLDTPVGEAGTALSGGERQRLCLARLLLDQHHVLIVDEPTEHLDHAAGQALVADLLALAPERSVVLISHEPGVVSAVRRHGVEVQVGVSAMSPTP